MLRPMAPLCALLWVLLALCSARAAAVINTGGGSIRGVRTLQGPLEVAPADLGDTCSSANLQTVAGIAACRTACRSALCCQTNIGSADCGYAACGSYGECNALVSIVDIGVPQGGNGEVDSDGEDGGGAGDGVDAGDGEDVGDIDDGEDVEDEGDVKMIVDGGMTTTKPTDDGTFNDPEDGSLLGAVGNAGSTIEDTELNDYDDLFNEFIVESKGDQDHGSGKEEEDDAELIEDGEMTTTKPTGDGTLNNPEEGSFLGAVGSVGSTIEDTFKQASTDPSSLSTGQIVGIAVGLFVVFCILTRLIKCCCCRKK